MLKNLLLFVISYCCLISPVTHAGKIITKVEELLFPFLDIFRSLSMSFAPCSSARTSFALKTEICFGAHILCLYLCFPLCFFCFFSSYLPALIVDAWLIDLLLGFPLLSKGESGLGKSTLINSLFLTDLYPERIIPGAAGKWQYDLQ